MREHKIHDLNISYDARDSRYFIDSPTGKVMINAEWVDEVIIALLALRKEREGSIKQYPITPEECLPKTLNSDYKFTYAAFVSKFLYNHKGLDVQLDQCPGVILDSAEKLIGRTLTNDDPKSYLRQLLLTELPGWSFKSMWQCSKCKTYFEVVEGGREEDYAILSPPLLEVRPNPGGLFVTCPECKFIQDF